MSRNEQQILAEQIKRLVAEPDIFRHGAKKFHNLLNDIVPGQRIERFWLCCVFENPSFVSALAQGKIQRADISRLEYFLDQKLGLSQRVARWVCETWAIVFGLESPEKRTSFGCPHCGRDGVCDESWRDRMATCPACNALIRFNSSLDINLEKRGWPIKRLKNRRWLLTDPEFAQSESALRKAIAQTIENQELSSSEIAKHIGLDLIIGSLQTEIMMLLGGMLNTSVAAKENVVKGVLKSAIREEYICFDIDDQFPPLPSIGTTENSEKNEKWLAVIGSPSKTPFHGLAFSDGSLHYAKDNERWAIPYGDLHQLPITHGDSITQLKLGEHRVVELKGLGVPRRAIQPVLSIIGKCIYEVSRAAWR